MRQGRHAIAFLVSSDEPALLEGKRRGECVVGDVQGLKDAVSSKTAVPAASFELEYADPDFDGDWVRLVDASDGGVRGPAAPPLRRVPGPP